MGRPRKTGRRRTASKCKSGRRCKGIRRTSKKTHSAYTIPKAFACAGMRGPATSVITTNGMYNSVQLSPGYNRALLTQFVGKTTNGGWSKQQVDDQQSSGLGFGPRPFRTG